MGIITYILMTIIRWDGGIRDAVNLVLVISASIAIYLGASFVLKIKEMRTLFAWIKVHKK